MQIHSFSVGWIQTNCYVVLQDSFCFIIDPGTNSEKQLSSIYNLIDQSSVSDLFILLTHGHFDHIMGVDQIAQRYHCDVYIAKNEYALAIDPFLNQSNAILHKDITIQSPMIQLSDRQIVTKNNQSLFEVIYTPGHTAGSCCYKMENAIFSGDTLFAGSIGRTDFPTGNHEQIMNSMCILRDYAKDQNFDIYPGHGESTSLQTEIKTNPYFKL
ncbi:MAG: MBL fold metallo-hydrolase [Clostridiales bacterium]|nr:MBL fold metallo-hydrolase [Clostridiales bacterium]